MLNFAIIGAGNIAGKMSRTIVKMDQVNAYAIASRNLSKAEKFVEQYGFSKAYGSYEEMLADDEIDLVYIATPHSHHFRHAKAALNAGKNVLCEKTFTVNAQQAKDLITLAREKNLLLAEAIWTRYMPSRKMIDDIIDSGIIGEIKNVCANIGYELSDIERLHDPKLAGGALLDLGVYLINFALMVLGDEIEAIETSVIFDKGVDISESITIKYKGNILAAMQCAANSVHSRMGVIMGTKGYIEVININNPEAIKIYNSEHQLIDEQIVPTQITGYEYQVEACIEAIENGKIECSEMPHSETIKVLEIMDDIRKSWNYEIPLLD